MDAPAAGAAGWPARLPWLSAVWWLAAANSKVVERERERERERLWKREGKWKNKRVFLFLKTHILQNYDFTATFLEP